MRVVFFGIGCAIPAPTTGHTSFMVTAAESGIGRTTVLTDAVDSPIRSMMKLGVDPLDLDVVIITHFHADHISALPTMLSTYNCMNRSKPLVIVANGDTTEHARRLLDSLELGPGRLTFPLIYRENYSDDAVEIRLTPGRHTVPTSMVRFETEAGTLFYTSDTEYHEGIASKASGCDMLIHEATAADRNIVSFRGHSSAAQAGKTAREAEARSLLLCHICYTDYENEAAIVKEAEHEFQGRVMVPQSLVSYPVASPGR